MDLSFAESAPRESTGAPSIAMLVQCSAILKGPPGRMRLSLIICLGPYVGPQPIEFFRAEHAAPRRHLALAVRDGLVETRPFVGAEPSQIKGRAGVHQSFSMTLRTMGFVDLRPGFDQGPVLRRCALCSHQRTENNAYSQARLHETYSLKATRRRRW